MNQTDNQLTVLCHIHLYFKNLKLSTYVLPEPAFFLMLHYKLTIMTIWLSTFCFQLLCGVPEGSILSPLLLILWRTPWSTIMLSYLNLQFIIIINMLTTSSSSILLLLLNSSQIFQFLKNENTTADAFSWISANLLQLNLRKSDFKLVGLPKQVF
jgi:hypothetical protein